MIWGTGASCDNRNAEYPPKRAEGINMKLYLMTEAEQQFANLVWEHAPLGSGELVQLCGLNFGWKKSTTYTVLRKLCDNHILTNENTVVTWKLSKEEYTRMRGEVYLDENYGGELPRFIAAFMNEGKLDRKQIDEITKLIEEYKEEIQ